MSNPVVLGPWWGGGVSSGAITPLAADSQPGDSLVIVGGDAVGANGQFSSVHDTASNSWLNRFTARGINSGGDILGWASKIGQALPKTGTINWVGLGNWSSINVVALNLGPGMTYESFGGWNGSTGAPAAVSATATNGNERMIVAAVAAGGAVTFDDQHLRTIYSFSDGTQTLHVAYRDFMPKGAYQVNVTPDGSGRMAAAAFFYSPPPLPPEPNWIARGLATA